MSPLKTTCLSVALLAFAGGAYAQADHMNSSKDNMSSSGSMHMSKSQMKMMHGCQAMSHDEMMKNSKCMKMMKMHPDMMKGDAMMKKGS